MRFTIPIATNGTKRKGNNFLFTVLLMSFSSFSILGQTVIDDCFTSATPATNFVSSTNLVNTGNSDLLRWTGSNWVGGWAGANITSPPPTGPTATNCRAVFLGSGTAWTTGGEGFAVRLNAPLVTGQNYSLVVTYISHGTGSTGAFSPQVLSSTNGTMAGSIIMASLPAVGNTWTANNYTFTATAAQNGHSFIIFRTTSSAPNISSGLVGSFCPTCITTLPIELYEFNYSCKDNSPILTWTTSSELNNDYFTLSHSINGTHFTEIAQVKGNGTTQTPTEYTFDQLDVFSRNEINYFQLSQTDFNGTAKIYKTVAGKSCEESDAYAYISNNAIHIKGSYMQTIILYDATGRMIHTETLPLNSSKENSIEISTELTSGVYQLVIYHKDTSVKTIKLVN